MMVLDLSALQALVPAFLLVFLRISAFMLAAPFFGSAMVSVRIRVVLAAAISLLLTPAVSQMPIPALTGPTGALLAVEQILVGLAMGFIVQLSFAAVTLAGQLIAMTMGLGFAMSLDPQNGVQVPVVSQFYVIIGTLVFLSHDLHLFLLEYLLGSFQVSPPQGIAMTALLSMETLNWAGQAFAAALAVSIPVIAGLLVINVCFGVMTRAAPALNIFAVGFPITIMAGFVLILLSLPGAVEFLGGFYQQTTARVAGLMEQVDG